MCQQRRLTYFYFTSPNNSLSLWLRMRKTSSHVFFRPFRKRTYSSMLRDNKIFVSVMCSLSEAVWLQSNLRQILFFSSPAGNGMEQKNEPPIIKTLRGRKDTLIAENKYPLRKVTVCDRGKNTYSISGWELLLSIDNQIPSCAWIFPWNPKNLPSKPYVIV